MEPDREVRPGWLPPKPPVPGAWEPPRTAYGVPRQRPQPSRQPSPPAAKVAIGMGATSLVLLLMTIGVGYPLCGVLSVIALILGMRSGHRGAIVLASIGIAVALAAAITWGILDANGYSPEDLQRWLEEQVERRREGAGARSF